MQEQRREQEQPANTVRRAVARQEPGVQEQRREQEQPADTVRRAVARQDPAVTGKENLSNGMQIHRWGTSISSALWLME